MPNTGLVCLVCDLDHSVYSLESYQKLPFLKKINHFYLGFSTAEHNSTLRWDMILLSHLLKTHLHYLLHWFCMIVYNEIIQHWWGFLSKLGRFMLTFSTKGFHFTSLHFTGAAWLTLNATWRCFWVTPPTTPTKRSRLCLSVWHQCYSSRLEWLAYQVSYSSTARSHIKGSSIESSDEGKKRNGWEEGTFLTFLKEIDVE